MVKSMNPLLLDPVRVYVGKLKSTIQSLEHKVDNFKKYDGGKDPNVTSLYKYYK